MRILTAVAVVLTIVSPCLAEEAPNRTPVDGETFAAIVDLYEYDHDLALHAEVLSTQTHDGRQLPYLTDKVHFRSIHDDEVVGYFAYPDDSTGTRYATVLLLHGNNRYRGSQDDWTRTWLDLLVREGYCALAIDQYGYGDRFVPGKAPNFHGDMGPYERSDLRRRHVVDVRRALDYLHSRSEVDTSRIGLFGISMGGSNGVKAAALEDRLACLILEVTGPWGGRDTHDPRYRAGHNLNFAPRVSAPVLMVSSEHDGVDRGNELFAALPEPKQIHWHAIDDHVILFEDTRDQVLGWLRRYLGD